MDNSKSSRQAIIALTGIIACYLSGSAGASEVTAPAPEVTAPAPEVAAIDEVVAIEEVAAAAEVVGADARPALHPTGYRCRHPHPAQMQSVHPAGEPMRHHHPMREQHGMPPQLPPALAMLALDEAQLQAISELQQAQQQARWQQRQQMRHYGKQLRQLYSADVWDSAAIMAIYDEMLAQQKAQAKAHIDHHNQIQAVLTEAQRQQLQQWKEMRQQPPRMRPPMMPPWFQPSPPGMGYPAR